MANDIYKDYSDEKLNKIFAYYKKELKYAEQTGKQSIIDTYNVIKDEMAKRNLIDKYKKLSERAIENVMKKTLYCNGII